jgi:predicted nuclease with TOPRIM domain
MKNERTSTALTKATSRLRGLRAINAELDFGNDRTVSRLASLTTKLEYKLERHNELLTSVESSMSELRELEKEVNELSSQMLKGVEFMYGQDSAEYELAGGVRTSDRVRRSRITRLKAAPEAQSTNGSKTA